MALAYRIVMMQLAAMAMIVVLLLGLMELRQAFAALTAGLVSGIPAAWFAWRATRERSASRLLGQGMLKFVLTVLLMAGAMAWLKPEPFGFFGTLMVLQAMYVVGPWSDRARSGRLAWRPRR